MPAISIEEALKQFDKGIQDWFYLKNIVESFLVNTRRYVEKVNNAIKQNEFEEHLKNITNQFLKSSLYYKDDYEINTEGRIDSVIKVNGKTQILIGNKKPSNKNEMATDTDINVKALHELLFYYMKLTRDTNNYHILDNDKIQSFQNLQDLFFEILGKRKREDTEFLNQFSDIPYLNSSLFERRLRIKELVSLLLDKPDEGYMKEIDEIIYDIYNISEYEIPMIEGKM